MELDYEAFISEGRHGGLPLQTAFISRADTGVCPYR